MLSCPEPQLFTPGHSRCYAQPKHALLRTLSLGREELRVTEKKGLIVAQGPWP